MRFQHEEMDLGYMDLDSVTTKRGRSYIDPDGTEYPSVTTVLKLLSEEIERFVNECKQNDQHNQ